MGYRFEIRENIHTLLLYRFGHVDSHELVTSTEKIFQVDGIDRIRNIVTDLTDADFTGLTTQELAAYGRLIHRQLNGKRIRLAIIAPSQLSYGLARMFEAFSDLDTIMVFSTRDEAWNWLGING